MREVDEAVRHEQVGSAFQKYAIPGGILLVVVLIALGAWLYWDNRREAEMERRSEELVAAIDELEAGNLSVADEELAPLVEQGGPGAAAAAAMLRAAIALEQGRDEEAVQLYDRVISDGDAPEILRNVALIRSVAARYEELDAQEVIDRLGPLATAGSPWFGSAGELVAMAYLAQGRQDQAGPLLAQIATDEQVPQTLRSRTRQMAGLLGYDAVEDVEEALAQMRSDEGDEPALESAIQ